jgi:hypothetical protein
MLKDCHADPCREETDTTDSATFGTRACPEVAESTS